jgi:Fur family transcriptional regulator, stress-responsive regulator
VAVPTPDPTVALRDAGLRVTGPRVAVLTALQAHPHADTETLADAARGVLGAVSTQAVYDVLRALAESGLVRRIEPAGSPARFELRVGDNHHHVVCRRCGAIADVDCAIGERPCLEPSEHHGFVIDEAEVVYWGLCPACSATDSAAFSQPRKEAHDRQPGQPDRHR